MGLKLRPGAVVPLELTLDDGDELLYPLAYVVDDAGASVAGSPFSMSHQAHGTYRNAGLVMPDLPFIRVTFVVFSDTAHTIDDTVNHGRDGITIVRDDSATGLALAGVQDDANDIQARLPSALDGDRMVVQVQGINDDAITADAVKTDAVAKLQSGLATAAALASAASQLATLLGLQGNHKFVDNTAYDGSNQLTGCRIRIFETAAEAAAATDGGSEPALATFTITASYESIGKMGTYRSVGP